MSNPKNRLAELDHLANTFVDDILDTPDAELLAESKLATQDHEKWGRTVLARATAAVGKRKLEAARQQLVAERRTTRTRRTLGAAESRSALQKLLHARPELAQQVSLAARQESEWSEEDVRGIIADLLELGVDVEAGHDD